MYHTKKSLFVTAKTRLLSFKTSERLNAHRIQLASMENRILAYRIALRSPFADSMRNQ